MKLTLIAFFIATFLCYSQNRYYSVLQKFQMIKNDSIKVDSINKFCWMNSTKDVYLSEELLKQNLKIAQQINYKKGIGKIYVLLGNIYLQKKDFQKAIDYYQQGLVVREYLNDKSGVAAVYGNIGNAFYLLKQFDKALEYQEKSLNMFKALEEQEKKGEYWFDIAECEISIGKIFIEQNKFVNAEKRFLEAVRLNEKINYYPALITSYNELAILYHKMNKFNLSNKYFNKILNLINKTDDKKVISDVYLNYSTAIFDKEPSKALNLCDQGLNLAFIIQDKENILKGLKLKSDILLKMEQFKLAMETYTKYSLLKDSIFNETTTRYFNDLQAKYEFTQKNNQIKLLEKEKIIKQSKIQQQQYFIIGTVIIIILIVVLLGYIYKSYKVTQTQKTIIELKNKDILESITYAKRIQKAILPNEKQWYKLLPNSFIYYSPKDIVAGDFYWIEEDDKYIYVAVADCTGHGVPGAMVSVICSTALTKSVTEDKLKDTDKILNRTREIVLEKLSKSEENIQDGMDVCLIRIEKNNLLNIQYSGANRPLYIINNQNELIELKPNKQPIGKFDNMHPFTKQELTLESNSMLYLVTDGFADQFGGEKNKKFSMAALKKLMIQLASLNLSIQKKAFESTLLTWKKNNEQTDDITLIGIKFV
ncbi:MAG: hypothetical protein KatS3mg027_0964 [Bacteroidia bacterium]|nr:MAG: hypothetical protein KatS3mg027_0964 [Bacteroidia bacterium]